MAHQALCPWAFLGKNTRMVCHFLLQEIFLTQGSNPGLLHYTSKTAGSLSSQLTKAYVIFAQLAQHFFHLLKYGARLLILLFLQREREKADELLLLI